MFLCRHEAPYRNIPRTGFPWLVESIFNLITAGIVPVGRSIRYIGYLFEKRSAFNSALPNFIHCSFGHRNSSLFVGERQRGEFRLLAFKAIRPRPDGMKVHSLVSSQSAHCGDSAPHSSNPQRPFDDSRAGHRPVSMSRPSLLCD